MAVPRDNVRTWRIGELEYELEAGLGTFVAYRNAFWQRLEKPYVGKLDDDMLAIWNLAQPVLEGRWKVDGDGNPVHDDDGALIRTFDPEVPVTTQANPQFMGYDVDALVRVAWAMAWSAGSTKKQFPDFYDEVMHQPAGVSEVSQLFSIVEVQLGGGIIFRRPEGPEGDAGADAQGAEEGKAE